MRIAGLLLFSIVSTVCHSQKGLEESTYLMRADSLIKAENWSAAASALESSLAANEKNGLTWYRLATVYQNMEKYKRSVDAYAKSLLYPTPTVPPIIIKASLAKAYALNKDSASSFRILRDMISNGYINFTDLSGAKEYAWLRSSKSFEKMISDARINAYPCLSDPRNREFDFWKGEWNVFQSGTDYQVGKSLIELKSGTCLVLENWTALGNPDEGKSMNYFNSKKNAWEQVYMGIGGIVQNYYNGAYKDGAMRFEGDGTTATGGKLLFHLSYFNQSDVQVRQLLESSSDDGKTWTTVYDFIYRRVNK